MVQKSKLRQENYRKPYWKNKCKKKNEATVRSSVSPGTTRAPPPEHLRIRSVDVDWVSVSGVVEAIMCLFYVPMSRCSVAGWGIAHNKVICSLYLIIENYPADRHLLSPTQSLVGRVRSAARAQEHLQLFPSQLLPFKSSFSFHNPLFNPTSPSFSLPKWYELLLQKIFW